MCIVQVDPDIKFFKSCTSSEQELYDWSDQVINIIWDQNMGFNIGWLILLLLK